MAHVTQKDRDALWRAASKFIPPADKDSWDEEESTMQGVVDCAEQIATRAYTAGYEAAIRDVNGIVGVEARRVIAAGLIKLQRERETQAQKRGSTTQRDS